MVNIDALDIVAGIVLVIVSYILVFMAQTGELTAGIFGAGITGYTLAGALVAGTLGAFISNYFRR